MDEKGFKTNVVPHVNQSKRDRRGSGLTNRLYLLLIECINRTFIIWVMILKVRRTRTNFIEKLTSYLYWTLYEEASVVRKDYVVIFGGGRGLS